MSDTSHLAYYIIIKKINNGLHLYFNNIYLNKKYLYLEKKNTLKYKPYKLNINFISVIFI